MRTATKKDYSKVALVLGEYILTKAKERGVSEDDVLILMQSGDTEFLIDADDFALDLRSRVNHRRRLANTAAQELMSMLEEYRKNPTENCKRAKEEIEALEVTLRTFNALKWLGIETIGELRHVHEHIQKSTSRNNSIPRLGKITRAELQQMAEYL